MPTIAEAKAKVVELSRKALEVVEDTALAAAEKKVALDKLEPDIKKWEDEVTDLTSVDAARKRFTRNVGPDGKDAGSVTDLAGDQAEKAWQRVGKSLGAQFIESPQYGAVKSADGRGGSWSSGTVELKGWSAAAGVKTLLSEGTSGTPGPGYAPIQNPTVLPGVTGILFQPLTIADLIPSGTATTPLIRYLVETAVTNAAAATAEGSLKPESGIAFGKVDETLHKITTFLPVTDEMLEDYAQIQAYIDARLTLFVKIQEETQLLRGDGTGSNLVGILNRAGLAPTVGAKGSVVPAGQTAAVGSYASPAADNDMDAIYRAITQVRVTSFLEPDAVVIDPAAWATIMLSKNAQGQYYAGGPFMGLGTAPSLWGKPVTSTTAMPANTALTGAFAQACQLFRKGGLTVEASNSHADFFQRNMTAIRAEERLGLAVYRPGAFGQVTGL